MALSRCLFLGEVVEEERIDIDIEAEKSDFSRMPIICRTREMNSRTLTRLWVDKNSFMRVLGMKQNKNAGLSD